MIDLQEQILAAYKNGSFFQVIERLILDQKIADDYISVLISLHNQSEINIVDIYVNQKSKQG